MGAFLDNAFIYLIATVIAVPLAQRLGLGAVLGYLVAGAAIGPEALGLVHGHGAVSDVAEFGVVMMLFLVGLELQPRLLWKMRSQLIGLGGLQLVGTAVVIMGAGWCLGLGWRLPLAAGLILAESSTAIVLQSLQERGLFDTGAGQASFAVLLFQDVSVIPILGILPLLAAPGFTGHAGDSAVHHWLSGMAGWLQAVIVLFAVMGVVAAGRTLINPIFRMIARTQLRDLFTAAALLLVISVALLMERLGMSPALGTFLAGVVLADSEFRHELQADIDPFKGILLGLFFISIGAEIDFHLMLGRPGLVIGLLVGFMLLKAVVLFGLARVFKLSRPDSWLFALALAQGGEFAFVLLTFVVDRGVMTPAESAPLVAAVALSMAVAPLLFVFYLKVIAPCFAAQREETKRPQDVIDEHDNAVLIAGFGRFGLIVGRLLQANGFRATVLDLDSGQVDTIRKLGLKVFYGDATRIEMLEAAGAAKAKLFVLAIDNEDQSVKLAETVRARFPNLEILARASGRIHMYRLMRAGVKHVYRETLDSSLSLAVDALRKLGVRGHHAWRSARKFRNYDEHSVRALAEFWEKDEEIYFSESRRRIVALEQLFETDRAGLVNRDPAWDAPLSRNDQ